MNNPKPKCLNCGCKMKNAHPNKKFCSNKGRNNCKDLYHNENNPRGYEQQTVDGVAVSGDFIGITDQEHEQIMNEQDPFEPFF